MAPYPGSDADYFKDKARRDLLTLLEGVRGKKNLVVSQDLAGPVGLFVKFSLLQEYGVDRVFLLENANVDSSQRNVVFLVHAEKTRQVRTVAGMSFSAYHRLVVFLLCARLHEWRGPGTAHGTNSRLRRCIPSLRSQSKDP
ncbi:hypothetical protein BDV39DRAFT_15189 [Aspergillus sergii]|uniref:Uncharacterized protein n=1 Tax=Aspergillus sergii TaxID=1034303 RepID=A0A5N6XDC6_9EURO|nr:hypothetical protein BDV39DRAFT_15189 [Aspergillus sergii]